MPDVPAPLATMRAITGTLEAPGAADNPVILAWVAEIAQRFPEMAAYCRNYRHDSIPWCGLCMAYVMAHNGIRPQFNPSDDLQSFLWANGWKHFGTAVDHAQPGDVLVFARHVSMCDGEEGDYYIGRGGNQSDSVKTSRYAKSSVQAIRRAPAASVTGSTQPAVPISTVKRFTGITATEFGGPNDEQPTAYSDVAAGWANRPGVALPYRFKGARPKVRVFKGGASVVCDIVDVGPWNTNDPYWQTGTRPQAETGTDTRGRRTNLAGIDLTPAAADAIGLNGKGLVDWQFGSETTPMTEPQPSVPTTIDVDKADRFAQIVAAAVVAGLQKAKETAPPPPPAQPVAPAAPSFWSLLWPVLGKVLPMLGMQGGLLGVLGTLFSVAQGVAGPVTTSPTTGSLLTGFGGAMFSGLFAKLFGKSTSNPTTTKLT